MARLHVPKPNAHLLAQVSAPKKDPVVQFVSVLGARRFQERMVSFWRYQGRENRQNWNFSQPHRMGRQDPARWDPVLEWGANSQNRSAKVVAFGNSYKDWIRILSGSCALADSSRLIPPHLEGKLFARKGQRRRCTGNAHRGQIHFR